MTTTVKKFTAKGNTYEVKMQEVIEKINSNGGAAPWMIGRKVESKKYGLFINGEDVCGVAFFKDNEELIRIGEMMGY